MDKNTIIKYLSSATLGVATMCIVLLSACGNDESDQPIGPTTFSITVNPATTHQEMIGFGGALTWYSNWLTASPHKNTIADLIFDDLGIDIIRFKSWYYPDNYPDVTSTSNMSDDNSKVQWDATNELYTMAKSRNPDVKTLLSSWGPPAALKSNNNTRQGTLKKGEDNKFMYGPFAEYWERTLDHLPFVPDYISIQNEPTYSNSGWTTCVWGSSESSDFPDYHIAFDSVYNRIKDRSEVPVMIGPESQDIPKYADFANRLKDKPHCGVLAYHPYNVNSGTSQAQIVAGLQSIGAINAKPNLMTEFSDNLNWFNTALFIQNSLIHANSSGYIYWKLAWATPSAGATDAGMVSLSNSGGAQYTVTPFYYLIKHFAKHIDAGYKRIDASSANVNLSVSAFKNQAGNQVTLVIINPSAGQIPVNFTVTGKTISGIEANQSKEGSYYQAVNNASAGNPITLSAQSITTVVLDI